MQSLELTDDVKQSLSKKVKDLHKNLIHDSFNYYYHYFNLLIPLLSVFIQLVVHLKERDLKDFMQL